MKKHDQAGGKPLHGNDSPSPQRIPSGSQQENGNGDEPRGPRELMDKLGMDRPTDTVDQSPVHNAEMRSGTQTGQTARGSYSTDPSTGAGGYADHTGTTGSTPIAQPGNDEEVEPDAIDPKL